MVLDKVPEAAFVARADQVDAGSDIAHYVVGIGDDLERITPPGDPAKLACKASSVSSKETCHLTGADSVTPYGFASLIFGESAKLGKPKLTAITSAEYPFQPTQKLGRTFGIRPKPLRKGLAACLNERFDQRGQFVKAVTPDLAWRPGMA